MVCNAQVGSLQIIFGKGAGEIELKGWSGQSLKITRSIADRGPKASFSALIKPGQSIPDTESLCLIRRVTASGFEQLFLGRYEEEAYKLKPFGKEFQFNINNLIDFAHRKQIEDYSRTTTWEGHIDAALEESGAFIPANALSLLDLQTPIVGDDGQQFKFEFKRGNLESFLNDLTSLKKARWYLQPVPFTDYTNKTTGTFGTVVIRLDGTNNSTGFKLDPATSHCNDASYIKTLGEPEEKRGLAIASRFTVSGRGGKKPTVVI